MKYASSDINVSNFLIPAGATYWVNDSEQLHREDGPACTYECEPDNITEIWFQHGIRHREDGPAIIRSSGTKAWYKDGDLHREDGPAVEWANGAKEWYLNGLRHRENGPAAEWSSGEKEWFINGRHIKSE